MIQSMTGFASKETAVVSLGKVCVELRSSNHKFLEISFHLPAGFLSWEDRIKRAIEAKIKRGRVICAINIAGQGAQSVFINKQLLENYIEAFRSIKAQFRIKGEPGIDTLIHLPGVLSLAESRTPKARAWPRINLLINQALEHLVATRQKEGRALCAYLKRQAEALHSNLNMIKTRFKKVIRDKLVQIKTAEERASFLKDKDISEEIERLAFHISNCKNRLSKTGPVGKELDFIAQEMQREANTMAAKSCDTSISARVVQIKSQIEKIREQAQNIE